jgi:hypothetical protein
VICRYGIVSDALRNNYRRGVWVPDRRSRCSLVRDDSGVQSVANTVISGHSFFQRAAFAA